MSDKHPVGRPPAGTGGAFVTVYANEGRSWQLCIGKELYREIGSPAYISLDRRGLTLHIAPEDHGGEDGTYTIIGGDAKSMPRVNIGKGIAAELRLVAGRYEQCRVRRGEILVMLG